MFVWVELPEDVNAEELLAKAIREKIAFVPGAPFFADQRRHNFHAPQLLEPIDAGRSRKALAGSPPCSNISKAAELQKCVVMGRPASRPCNIPPPTL